MASTFVTAGVNHGPITPPDPLASPHAVLAPPQHA
jgi:hypothetical protein